MRKFVLAVAGVAMVMLMAAPGAQAVHFYRGSGGGCTPADGATTNDPAASGTVAATVLVMHNTFNDSATGLPVTTIKAGEAVRWTWNSSHCHSVGNKADTSPGGFYSGYHYPTATPESPQVVPGFFDYPVPDMTPTLSYTRTFTTPGTYQYTCEHHAAIGMVGAVVVQ